MVLDPNSDYNKDFGTIAVENGFVYDEYEVKTDDGYLLTLFRVRLDCHALDGGMQGAPVVFLQHGLVSAADTFIAHYADFAPAFVYARQGYDVWLGNNRGS